MNDWKLVAAIPPLLLWFALFIYLNRINRKVEDAERKLRSE
jgi:hypothetical protein